MGPHYIAYIIPWFDENDNPVNERIRLLFERQGIEAKICRIHWKRRVMSDYVEEFLDFYAKNPPWDKKVILFGFSFGAFASMLLSEKIRPDTKILCSVSPYWREDLLLIPKYWKRRHGRKRIECFEQFSYKDFLSKSIGKTYILVWGDEHLRCIERSKAFAKGLNVKCSLIPHAPHDIAHPNYFQEIETIIKTLNS